MIVIRRAIVGSVGTLLLCGPGMVEAKTKTATPPKTYYDSTPYISVEKTHHADGEQKNDAFERSCYVKLSIDPTDTMKKYGAPAQIKHLPRGKIPRFFKGVDYTFTTIMKAESNLYEESVVLYSRKYRSSRKKGENHDRSVLIEGGDYPVFLRSGDTNDEISFTFDASMKNSQTVDLAGSALSAFTASLKAVAPTSGIVTKLTDTSSKSIAQKIDAGAGAFLGTTGQNRETVHFNMAKDESLTITVYGPEHEVNFNTMEAILGEWKVTLEMPFASYFDQTKECKKNGASEAWGAKGDNANILSQTLLKNVGDYGTVGSYLKHLEWWTSGVTRMTGKGANSPEVEGFCRKIVRAVSDLGFNTVDSYLVADAVARSSLVGAPEGKAMIGAKSCDYNQRRL